MKELEMDQLCHNAGYYLVTSSLREKGVLKYENLKQIER